MFLAKGSLVDEKGVFVSHGPSTTRPATRSWASMGHHMEKSEVLELHQNKFLHSLTSHAARDFSSHHTSSTHHSARTS